ncbi:hypothetical protein QE370_000842 [Aeromicrobium sp. SORGH_AS981]|uniref:hypothetical protein n=1 Tax=Aeromicrobium sp. SORGH_AS_0981 TaxID=3041802 RepID=UPI002856C72F|nr:hypothetical protein [Aeromicrobium sp. SORGH_AS_0981]MDR6117658.1 hypothetical protein [Aeromicrobium sp. SORGH_AS_0981]
MHRPSRSWTTIPGILVHWTEMTLLALAYVYARHLVGVDPTPDWDLAGSIVLLGTLVLFLVWNYGRPRPR